ncbi:MAG: DUF87 domain-containing protein [Firmicutes bacterium]|nr:DUF87 domain-containing protein [Bacillota bacterium]
MRIIPKKSRVNVTIWKNFTLSDLLFILALFGVALLILISNIRYKWVLLLVFVPVAIALFFSNDDVRMYREVSHLVKFLFAGKLFERNAKKSARSIDNLIPAAALDDDGIICYGEYFAGVLSVGSIEFRLLTEFSQDSKVSGFAKILNALTAEQSMQLVKIDRPINFDEISGKLFDKIEAAKKEVPQDNAKIAVLKSRIGQIDQINNVEKLYRPFYYVVLFDPDRESLCNTLEFVAAEMHELELSASRLSCKELALFLKYCYTRDFDEREIEDVAQENYLDFVKPEKVKFTANSAEVDGVYSCTFTVWDYPMAVTNAWGAGIFNIDNTKVVLNIKPVDKEKSIKRIDRAVVELSTKEVGNKASKMLAQDTHIETMAGLLTSLQNENECLFDCTLTVTGFNHEKESNSAFRKKLRRQIISDGFRAHALFCRQFDGFVSSSITRRNRLRYFERGINSESLAAVFPFVFTSIIEPDGLTLGYNNYPVILDLWKRSPAHVNSNMFILGKSGSGKSYFNSTLLELLYSDDCKIYIIDPENEYKNLCENFDGAFIDVGNATTGRLNPFHIYQILSDDGDAAAPDTVFWAHLRFMESFFLVTLPGITQDSLEELNNLVVKCYAAKKITPYTDCSALRAESFPTFDTLLKLIKAELAAETNGLRKGSLQRIETYIQKFAEGGRNSNLWNGASTLKADEKFIVFNFQSLLSSKNNTVANGQMLMVMRYLEQQIINIRERNRNSEIKIRPYVGIDELLSLADPKYPFALDFTNEQYRRIRKYDGLMCVILQSLAPLIDNKEISGKMSAILSNSQYSFIFSLLPADVDILTGLYNGAVNENESNEIAAAGVGQCFLISSPCEHTTFRVVADEVIEALFQQKIPHEELAEFVKGFS